MLGRTVVDPSTASRHEITAADSAQQRGMRTPVPGKAMSSGTATSSGSATWERSPKVFRNRREKTPKWIEGLLLAKEIAPVKEKIGAFGPPGPRGHASRLTVPRSSSDSRHRCHEVITKGRGVAGRRCGLLPDGVWVHMRLADLNPPANFLIVER